YCGQLVVNWLTMKTLPLGISLLVLILNILGSSACGLGEERFLPSKIQCDKYYRCSQGVLSVQYCGFGTSFDVRYGKCRPNKWVECGQRRLSRVVCPSETGRFAVKGECHLYNVCRRGSSRIFACAPGTVFSTKSKSCILPIALPPDHPCSAESVFGFKCQSQNEEILSREVEQERLGLQGLAGFGLGALFSPLVFKKKALLARPFFAPPPMILGSPSPVEAPLPPPVEIRRPIMAGVPMPRPFPAPIQTAQIQPSMQSFDAPPPRVATPQIQTISKPQRIDLIIERPRPVINQIVVTRTQDMVVTSTIDRPQYVDVMVENKRPFIGDIVMNVAQPVVNTIMVDKPQMIDVTMESIRPVMQTVYVERPFIVQRPVVVDRLEKVDVVLNQESNPASFHVPSMGMMGEQSTHPVSEAAQPTLSRPQTMAEAFAQVSGQGMGASTDGMPAMETNYGSNQGAFSQNMQYQPSAAQSVQYQPNVASTQSMQYQSNAASTQSMKFPSNSYSVQNMPTVSNCRIDCGPGLRSATSLIIGKPESEENRSGLSFLEAVANKESEEYFLAEDDEDRSMIRVPGCRRTCFTIIDRTGRATRICQRKCRPVFPMHDDDTINEDDVETEEKNVEGFLDLTITNEETGKKVHDPAVTNAIVNFLKSMENSPKRKVAVNADKEITSSPESVRIPITIVPGTVSGHIKEDGITVDKFSLRDEPGKMLDIPETKINEMHEIIKKLNLPLGEFQLDAAILTSADQVALDDAAVIEMNSGDTNVKIAEDHTTSGKTDLTLPIAMIAKAAEVSAPEEVGMEASSYSLPRSNKPHYDPCLYHLTCLRGRPLLHACPRGMAFSRNQGVCVRKEEAGFC
ncbi:hypothetical protein QYM36_010804, partial [Artemia franciscana]